MPTLVALLGHPVAHSRSPAMHDAAFAALGLRFRYEAIDVPPEQLVAAVGDLVARGARGANVTIPHKESIVPLCHDVDRVARAAGAVNTLVIDGGRVRGTNTDVDGIVAPLRDAGVAGARFAILGAGGAARAAVAAARRLGASSIACVNRRVERARDLGVEAQPWTPDGLGTALAGAGVLINASAMGLAGAAPPCEAPLDALAPDAVVFDFVYEPRETPLLAAARERRLRTIDGLTLLVLQGAASFRLWTGREAPVAVMRRAAEAGA